MSRLNKLTGTIKMLNYFTAEYQIKAAQIAQSCTGPPVDILATEGSGSTAAPRLLDATHRGIHSDYTETFVTQQVSQGTVATAQLADRPNTRQSGNHFTKKPREPRIPMFAANVPIVCVLSAQDTEGLRRPSYFLMLIIRWYSAFMQQKMNPSLPSRKPPRSR